MSDRVLLILAILLLMTNAIGLVAIARSYIGVRASPAASRRLRPAMTLMCSGGVAISIAMLIDASTQSPSRTVAPTSWPAQRSATFEATPMTEQFTVPGAYTLAYVIDFTGIDELVGPAGSGRTSFEATGGTAQIRVKGSDATSLATHVLRYDAATDGWTILDSATVPPLPLDSGQGLSDGVGALYTAAGLDQRRWVAAEMFEAAELVHAPTGAPVRNGYEATQTGEVVWHDSHRALWRLGGSSQRHSRATHAGGSTWPATAAMIALYFAGAIFIVLGVIYAAQQHGQRDPVPNASKGRRAQSM